MVGKRGKNLTPEAAVDYIAGYLIFCDGSARDMAGKEYLGLYKMNDFGTNLGPCLVTPDEVGDEMNLRCSLKVNGEPWYEGNTGWKRNYTMPQLLAYASDEEEFQSGRRHLRRHHRSQLQRRLGPVAKAWRRYRAVDREHRYDDDAL